MKLELQTTIRGNPVAKGSPRMTKSGRAYPHAKSAKYIGNVSEQLAALWDLRESLDCAIHLEITVVVQRPLRLRRKKDPCGRVLCTKKPDIDNYAKSILDAVTKSCVWVDDAQVCGLSMRKFYAGKTEDPCVELEIWRAE